MRIFAAILLILLICPISSFAAKQQGIAAVVGENAISTEQVQERVALLIVSAGMKNDKKTKTFALNGLIDEELKLTQAENLGIIASQNDVDSAFANIAKRNGFSLSDFKKAIRSSGIDPRTMEDKLRAEIVWHDVISSVVAPKVSISQGEIDSALAKAEKDGKSVSRQGIEQSLLQARTNRAAAQYLRKLKARTFIEIR